MGRHYHGIVDHHQQRRIAGSRDVSETFSFLSLFERLKESVDDMQRKTATYDQHLLRLAALPVVTPSAGRFIIARHRPWLWLAGPSW